MEYVTTVGIIAVKTGVNVMVPGLGAVIDFAQGAADIAKGDYIGAVVNVGSGVFDLLTLGVWGAVKSSGKAAAKELYIKATKDAAKKVTKEIGQNAGKEIAKGACKESMVNAAKASAKQATKKIGRKAGEEIGKNVIKKVVEKSAYDATKSSVQKIVVQGVFFGTLESGGKNIGSEICKQTFTLAAEEVLKIAPTSALSFAANESCKVLTKEFAKTNNTILIGSGIKSAVFGAMNTLK